MRSLAGRRRPCISSTCSHAALLQTDLLARSSAGPPIASVLKLSGTVLDLLVCRSRPSVWHVHLGHAEGYDEYEGHEDERQATLLLLSYATPSALALVIALSCARRARLRPRHPAHARSRAGRRAAKTKITAALSHE